MKRREFITLVGGTVAAWPFAARAQQAGKQPTIGFLGAAPSIESQRIAAFVQRLRELGWTMVATWRLSIAGQRAAMSGTQKSRPS